MYTHLVVWGLVLNAVAAQDCHTYGEVCQDDTNCCGGCCIHGNCVDTYQDCRVISEDPCSDYACGPDEYCFVFQPTCQGCEPVRECKTGSHDSSSHFPDVRSTMLFHYSGASAFGGIALWHLFSFLPLYLLLK